MPRLYTHRFVVAMGQSTNFPIDMLRYDGVHPYTAQDASNITHSFDRVVRDEESAKGRRHDAFKVTLIKVAAERTWKPTIARWASFGWNYIPGTQESYF